MTTPSEAVEIYCVKCKAKTASRDIEAVTMKNGRAATRSICADCGTKKFRIGVLLRRRVADPMTRLHVPRTSWRWTWA